MHILGKAFWEYDCGAHGVADCGMRFFLEELSDGETVFVMKAEKSGSHYELDCDSAGQLIRIATDRFTTWCTEADDYDAAMFAGVLADKIRWVFDVRGIRSIGPVCR